MTGRCSWNSLVDWRVLEIVVFREHLLVRVLCGELVLVEYSRAKKDYGCCYLRAILFNLVSDLLAIRRVSRAWYECNSCVPL